MRVVAQESRGEALVLGRTEAEEAVVAERRVSASTVSTIPFHPSWDDSRC